MTPIAGFIIAVIAGWMVWDGRRAAGTVLIPWLGVLAVQSWGLASGRGVSPPSTVTRFPDLIGYWALQAVFLAFALGIAGLLGALRARRHNGSAAIARTGRQAAAAAAILIAAVAVLAVLFAVLAPGPRLHHSATGSPPWYGFAGMALCIVAFAALSMVTIRHRRAARRAANPELEQAAARAA